MPRRDTSLFAALAATMLLAVGASWVAPEPLEEPAASAGAPQGPTALVGAELPPKPPAAAPRTLVFGAPEPVTICGPHAWLGLLRRALGATGDPLEWREVDDRAALDLARADRLVVAVTANPQPLPGLAARPLLSRAIAVLGPDTATPDVSWARLRELARRARGGLTTTMPSELLLACGTCRGLPQATSLDLDSVRVGLTRGAIALVELPNARALGRLPYRIDGVAPTSAAVRTGHYPLGFTLRVVHRFDVDRRASEVVDRLLGATVEANLHSLWPE